MNRVRERALAQLCFTGTSHCPGMVGDVPCDRVLAYACEATYEP